MMRKPAPWIVLAILCLLGGVTAFKLFPHAFPLLAVDIQMDREAALEEARVLADRFLWEPTDFRQAASFGRLDPTFQTYMELEAGGLEEVNRRVREGEFALYAWRVRHFAQGVVNESTVRFTPGGDPYGFNLILSEDQPGTNLPSGQARERAMTDAARDWGVDPANLVLLESSEEEQPGGRIDHTFVYQRTDLDLGEAELRLRLRMAGDLLAEVTRFSHVPEAFQRNYQSTRDANNAIWLVGSIIFVVLFAVLGGGGGMIFIIRQRWVVWKAPLVWGGIVAGLMALSVLNSLPLTWMQYDTATAPGVFVGSLVTSAVLLVLFGTPVLAFLFMAGESLLRKGFPDQLQQWKLWSPGVANSTPALGLTAAPYLILGIKLGYVVLFYLATTRLFGWWSPASSLVEPDMLATYFPWLSAVSTSLFAATWEESVFRAIPIGAAAILGRRYGRPWAWIWGAILLQAVVFGASHANYPQQPAYARVVEIFPSYLAWGVICAYFGLVPSIIGHFSYNLTLFSIPIFGSSTPGIWWDRGAVILIGLLPLAVLLLARWRYGGVSQAPEWARNRSWTRVGAGKGGGKEGPLAEVPIGGPAQSAAGTAPSESPGEKAGLPEDELPPAHAHSPADARPAYGPPGPAPPIWARILVGVATLAGLGLWVTNLPVGEIPALELSRTQAEAVAREALEAEGTLLDEEWTPLFSVVAPQSTANEFAWRQGTPEEYQALFGRFLDPPHWRVEFVRFRVEPEERAEEYAVRLGPSGDLLELRHRLPEARPGESLDEGAGRALATRALAERFGAQPGSVREISAEETDRPNRTDWTFTFSAVEGYPYQEGEGRLAVYLAGDEVTGWRRSVHVPEEWEREWRAEEEARMLAAAPLGAVLFLLALAAAGVAVVRGARGTLARAPFVTLVGALLATGIVAALNEWPSTLGTFGPEEAFTNQVGYAIFGALVWIGILAGGVALLGGLAHSWIQKPGRSAPGPLWWGLGLGFAATGLVEQIASLSATAPPAWPSYSSVVSYLPWLSAGAAALEGFLTLTSLALLLLVFIQVLRGRARGWLAVPLLLLVGLALSPNTPGLSWVVWAVVGLAVAAGIGLAWVLCKSLGWGILPGLLAAPALLDQAEILLAAPYPGSIPGALLGIIAVSVGMVYWTRALGQPTKAPRG